MSKELGKENPANLNEMRREAHEWLTLRPMIKHTPLSLLALTMGELGELKDAISIGKNEEDISLELGDVFFSVLSLDDRLNSRFNPVGKISTRDNIKEISIILNLINTNPGGTFTFSSYKPLFLRFGYQQLDLLYTLIFDECEKRKINPFSLFEKTRQKNNINYPEYFFNGMTPFSSVKDSISCLKIIRRDLGEDRELLVKHWIHMNREIRNKTSSFFDGWDATGAFRGYVKSVLEGMLNQNDVDHLIKAEIQRLLKKGVWDKAPFVIDGDCYRWH